MLTDWNAKFGARSLIEHAALSPSFAGDVTPPAAGVALDATVEAIVSGSRWIAQCPTDGCAGAEYVNLDAPWFFCCECRNAAVGHQLVQVALPAPQKRRDIEAYLIARPAPATRNWNPGETVADLRDENRARGIRLLKDES